MPAWGPADAPLLVVGLAPGLHGAHRTGIPFFGDASGELLMSTLESRGYATPRQPNGQPVRISNAVKCLPPGNLPQPEEVRNCARFLLPELKQLAAPEGHILTLGGVAHRAVLAALGLVQARLPFGHGHRYELADGRRITCSYHPSRLNVNTRRLSPAAFSKVVAALQP